MEVCRSIPLVYETILLGVALYKAMKLSGEVKGHSVSRLLHILIRDQIFYYVMCVLSQSVEISSLTLQICIASS